MTGGDPLKRARPVRADSPCGGTGLQVALTPSATPLATVRRLSGRGRPACSAWESAWTAPTRPPTTPFAAGKAASIAPGDAGQRPRVANGRAGEHDDHAAATSTRSTPSPSCWPTRASPCGRCSSWCPWDGAWRNSGSRGRVRGWSSSGCGITPDASPTRSRRPRPRTTGGSCCSRTAIRWPGPRPSGRRSASRSSCALGVGDGKGVMFVSHIGEIYSGRFLPLCCGRFPESSVVDVVSEPSHLPGPARSRSVSREVCDLRVPGQLWRQSCRGPFCHGDPLASEPNSPTTVTRQTAGWSAARRRRSPRAPGPRAGRFIPVARAHFMNRQVGQVLPAAAFSHLGQMADHPFRRFSAP